MTNDFILLKAVPATREALRPFGDLIQADGADSFLINNGTTERMNALAKAETGEGDAIISIFRGQPFEPPVSIFMMERHPLGSQAFFPLQNAPWLAVVAADEDGVPGPPQAFLLNGNQGIQYNRNVWHHPLISMERVSDFLVVDRQGEGNNLEECDYAKAYQVTL